MAPVLPTATLASRNDALNINPPTPGTIHITPRGSDWLWTVTAIDFFTLLAFLGLLYTKPRTDRIFHYITVLIIIVTGISYYTMASDIGWADIPVEWVRSEGDVAGSARQIFWVRYVDWGVTGPLIIMDLLLTAGVYWHTILYSIVLYVVYVFLLIVGAITPSTYKWGYFTLAIVALALVLENICWAGLRHSSAIGGPISTLYRVLAATILILWILYPISWGVSEGGNVIAPDSEQIFYGILDVLSKPVLGTVLLLGHTRIDITQLDLRLYDRVESEGNHGIRRSPSFNEKQEQHNDAPAPPAEATPAAPAPAAPQNGAAPAPAPASSEA